MRPNSLKSVAGRVHKLEIQYGVEATPKPAIPSAEQVIFERLLAGDWECALELLELPAQDVLPAWQSMGHRSTSTNALIDIDLADQRLRQRIFNSLADLPELRCKIAEKLVAADNRYSRDRHHENDDQTPSST